MVARKAGRSWGLAVSAVAVAMALAGCDSARFGGRGPELSSRRPPSRSAAAEPPPVQAIPSESVTSEPLPPPPGSPAPGPSSGFGSGPVVADVPSMPVVPAPVDTSTPVVGGNPAKVIKKRELKKE